MSRNFIRNIFSFGSPTSADENGDAAVTGADPTTTENNPKGSATGSEQQQQQQQDSRKVRGRSVPPALKMLPLLQAQAQAQPQSQPQSQSQHGNMPMPHMVPRRPLRANSLRERSLSRVFTQLPLVLPQLGEIQLDVVEWYCHVCLLETDPVKLQHNLMVQLSAALGTHKPRTYGRLYNRLHMVALWNDICGMPLKLNLNEEGEEGSHAHSHAHAHSSQADNYRDSSIAADQWQQVREQLVLLKSYLLRQDANLPVPTLQQVPNTDAAAAAAAATDQTKNVEDDYPIVETEVTVPPSQAAPDGQLEKHDMFQEDYQQVLLLLHVHQVLAKFKESLQKIATSSSQQSQQQNKKDTVTSVNKRAEQAIDAYENSLLTVFENHKIHSKMMSSTTADLAIPKELTAFLLRDLYQKGSNHKNQQAANVDLVTSLQDHVRRMCLNVTSEYSHASLKTKMRALLIKWSESILDIPVLVLQGYGGVTNPVVEHEGDDVSSWGEEGPPVNEVGGHVGDGGDDDDQPLMTQVETLDLEEAMDDHDKLISPTATTTNATTHTKASGSTVTEEDRVILQKLGEIESPVAQRTVRKMPRSAALIAKDDAEDAMDMEPLSTQAAPARQPMMQEVPLMTQPSEPAQEDDGYVAGDENLEGRKQAGNGGGKPTKVAASSGYIPSMRELIDGTDAIFNEVTDPDSIQLRDVFKSLSERFGFKLGKAQRTLVVERLTELMVAKTAPLTNGDNNANKTPPRAAAGGGTANAVSANDSVEETDVEAESDKASANGGEENDEKPAAKKRAGKRSNEFKSIEWPDSDSVSEADYVSPRRSYKRVKTTRKAFVYADRKLFTEDEVAALREGIDKHGVGKWQQIINDSNGRLDGRSGVQVKDKYRTMLRSGKIGNPESHSGGKAEQQGQVEQQDSDPDVAHI